MATSVSLPGYPWVRGHIPWAALWPLGPHAPAQERSSCAVVLKAKSLLLTPWNQFFLPEYLKISWIPDTGTCLPTVLPSRWGWGQPSAPGDRGCPAPVLLLSMEITAELGRKCGAKEDHSPCHGLFHGGMAQTLPHLGKASSGSRACPCAQPGGWEGSSWDLQAMTLQSPVDEDWGGHCWQQRSQGTFPVGISLCIPGKARGPRKLLDKTRHPLLALPSGILAL